MHFSSTLLLAAHTLLFCILPPGHTYLGLMLPCVTYCSSACCSALPPWLPGCTVGGWCVPHGR
eukprot:4991365-Alexandrium_andersonii.AAC.1